MFLAKNHVASIVHPCKQNNENPHLEKFEDMGKTAELFNKCVNSMMYFL